MSEFLYPGVYMLEQESSPMIGGAGVAAGAMLIQSERGPDDKPGLVTSFNAFKRLYGSFYNDLYGPYAVKSFFDQGGKRLYLVRVVKSDVAKATKNLAALGGSATTITADAKWKGAYGNGIGITTLKASTTLAAQANENTAAPVEITLDSVSGIEVGDVAVISDGSHSTAEFVIAINSATSKITLARLYVDGAAGHFSADITTVKVASTHAARSILTEDYSEDGTSAVVENPEAFSIGSLVIIIDTTTGGVIEAVVETKNGNTLGFKSGTIRNEPNPLAGGKITADDSVIVSIEFGIKVLENGSVVESHANLSLTELNAANHIDARLHGNSNQSEYIDVEDKDNAEGMNIGGRTSGVHFEAFRYPVAVSNQLLSAGADGGTPTDNEIIAAFSLLDIVSEISMVAVPGVTSVTVIKAGEQYCRSTRGDSLFIFDAPLTDCQTQSTAVLDLVEFRDRELNIDTSWAALYAPWVEVLDQVRPNTKKVVPPSGFMMGIMSELSASRGVHKAPANEELVNALGLTVTFSDQDQAVLNPKGINAIRPFVGRGIRAYGARTLSSKQDGKHYINVRRLINYISKSVYTAMQDEVFEPNDEDLWRKIEQTTRDFLYGMWQGGQLFPRDDVSKAYYAYCNATTNTQRTVNEGKVITEIGINPSKPAEFVIFKLALYEGYAQVQE
jgi:hypothetical protein